MLKLYNTLTRKKEIFRPLEKKKVKLFVCGPTVYDFSHLGHARTYIVFDMIAKYLQSKNFEVFYLQNITDIDDKIIERAKKEKKSWKVIAQRFEKAYLQDMKTLNITSVTQYARATDHIKEIIEQVQKLLQKSYAYQTEDGIYYDISKFPDYGKLAKRTVSQAQDAISRIDESIKKRNKGDFALWKFSKKDEPSWQSPWGKGRPGWHIEDTAITEKYFGPQYDIHGGAKDLIFPHHEAEIAQMEAISGKKPMVRYWLHSGFLTVRGQKMSKSLGNFITIKDFLKDHSARELRFLILKTHYRSPLNYEETLIKQTKKELAKIDEFLEKLKTAKGKDKKVSLSKLNLPQLRMQFYQALEDDFNTPKALAIIFKIIQKGNSLLSKNQLSSRESQAILKFFKEIDYFLNFIFFGKKEEKIPTHIKKLVKEREEARKAKNWEKADALRRELLEKGYQIEDTPEGPKIKKLI